MAMPVSTWASSVHGDPEGTIADLGGRPFRARPVQVGDDDPRPFPRKAACDLISDAARGTGDDGDFILETHDGSCDETGRRTAGNGQPAHLVRGGSVSVITHDRRGRDRR
jgi:hypothetical protein